MPRVALPFSALLLATTLGVACDARTSPPPTKVEAAPGGVQAALAAAPQADPQDAATPVEAATQGEEPVAEGAPKITADAAVHEFGAIKATDSIEHVFTIRNAGTADLKIERVQRT